MRRAALTGAESVVAAIAAVVGGVAKLWRRLLRVRGCLVRLSLVSSPFIQLCSCDRLASLLRTPCSIQVWLPRAQESRVGRVYLIIFKHTVAQAVSSMHIS